ncbi:MFS transporter [Thermomonas sp.]|uniref:MFS transporter n=1 Tax=Thermomonas sp. TaxID=1971895 RepID=UPI0024880B1E|nr:MFS transporter [Thermomonas sp.]MDI1252603.1 MFS transporter [Thermomonas sp.]
MSGHSQFGLLHQRRFLPFFVVQCLGAFNDNVFRNATIVLITSQLGLNLAQQGLYTNLAPALFILPFFLFSALAGQFAEKYEKTRLIRFVKIFEIVAMAVAAWGFYAHHATLLLVVLFLMGMHSTMFGPIKYSILPQALEPRELVGGNGLVETGTALSILFGMMLGGSLMLVPDRGPALASIAVLLIALVGYVASRAIPPAPATAPDLKINWNIATETLRLLKLCTKQRAVFNSILGISWFWFLGTALTAQLPVYAETNLGGGSALFLLSLGVFSIGTGIGSLLCEKLSGRTVEIGLVPLGAFGVSAFLLDLYFARPGDALLHGLDVAGFLHAPGSLRVLGDLLGIGMFGGFFLVPLFALVQNRTPRSELSRVIAGNNIINAGFIVTAAVSGLAAGSLLHWSIPQFFLALAIANTVVAIYIFTLVPEFLMRLLSWVLVRTLYKLRVQGIDEHIPDEGAALVVCNHVSYMDALILSASIPRPARFVMYYKIFNIPVMRWIFRTAKAIPIAGAREDPALMQRAFDAVDAALAEGELVCIFPEGALTKDGEIAAFKSGVEKILESANAAGRPVLVIPMALRNMWGSLWSKRDSRLGQMRVPRRFRAHVEVVAGAAVNGIDATAEVLETKVRGLRGNAA